MKYRFIFLFLLLSCTNYSSSINKKSGYSSSGFAYIEKNSSTNSSGDKFFVSHNKLRVGTKIKIINPNNNKSLEFKINDKIKNNNFYKILISKSIVEELELSLEFPFVEVNEIKSNKSFIAKKAITEIEEKKIANKAPVDKININNISLKEKKPKIIPKTYSILVAEFYNKDSAEFLKKKLLLLLKASNYKLIYINKKSEKKYELLMGPYKTINKLKNDYIVLNDSNFEDLDIITNE